MPDIDTDFCPEGRDEIIRYVTEKYGSDRVSQIITFGKMQARAVIRDVGRVLGYTYAEVDQVAKAVPMDLGMTLKKALEVSTDLRAMDDGKISVTPLHIDLTHRASVHDLKGVLGGAPPKALLG